MSDIIEQAANPKIRRLEVEDLLKVLRIPEMDWSTDLGLFGLQERGLRSAAYVQAAERLEQSEHYVSVLLDLFASLPAVPADAQETVDQIQRERDQQ